MIRNHVAWSERLAARLGERSRASRSSPSRCCRCSRSGTRRATSADLDEHNLALVNAINDDGRIYLTQTRVDGRVAIRFQAGQFETTEADVDAAFDVITEIAAGLLERPTPA